MAHMDRVYEDAKIAHLRTASWVFVLGWVFLCMAALGGIYVFQVVRDGSYMWYGFEVPTAVIGLILVAIGMRRRSRFS